jgi:hypothetical protein
MSELAKILSWLGKTESKEERDDYLKEKEYDLDELDERGVNLFGEIIAKNKLQLANEKKDLLRRAKKLIQAQDDSFSLNTFLSSLNTEKSDFAYQFSKFKNITENDALGMLNDEELLKIIEKLKKADQ